MLHCNPKPGYPPGALSRWRNGVLACSLLLAGCLHASAHAGELAAGLEAYRNQDFAQAFLLLQPLADQGAAPAQFVLGEMYRKGRGFTRSVPEALPLYQSAAQAGHAPAMNVLGEMHESGDGVVQDFAKATAWFQQAADHGNAKAMLNLALHYIRIEEKRDFAQAAHWFKRAAEQHEAEAQYFYARLLLEGKGIEENVEEAQRWLGLASAQGHVAAQRFLHVYRQPEGPDRALAIRDLKRSLAVGESQITAVATDAAYGFDKTNPIKTGLGFETEWRYLNALRGPKGEVVHYRRLGLCCPFDSEAAIRGKGFLDQYELTYDGLDKPIVLYLNMFEESVPLAPMGFGFAQGQD